MYRTCVNKTVNGFAIVVYDRSNINDCSAFVRPSQTPMRMRGDLFFDIFIVHFSISPARFSIRIQPT